jgi:hypothetical protein
MELVGLLEEVGEIIVGRSVFRIHADDLGEADAGKVVAVEAVFNDGEGVENADLG